MEQNAGEGAPARSADQAGNKPQDQPPAPLTGAERGRDNRGRRAGVTKNGEVVGSGASAGGKGGPEDFDSDPQAGGGRFVLRHERERPSEGGDAPQHNSA
jgi:hypothetical protein